MATNKKAAPKVAESLNLKDQQLKDACQAEKKAAHNFKTQSNDEKPSCSQSSTNASLKSTAAHQENSLTKIAKPTETKPEHVEVKKAPEIIRFVSRIFYVGKINFLLFKFCFIELETAV